MVFRNSDGGKSGYDNFAEGGQVAGEAGATGLYHAADWGNLHAGDMHRLSKSAGSASSYGLNYGANGDVTALNFADNSDKVGKSCHGDPGFYLSRTDPGFYLSRGPGGESDDSAFYVGGRSGGLKDDGNRDGGMTNSKLDLAYDDPASYGLVGHIGGPKDRYEAAYDAQGGLNGGRGDSHLQSAKGCLPDMVFVDAAKQAKGRGTSSMDV